MDYPRVGAVGYATEQGLGRLMKSFFDAGCVDKVMVFRHTSPRRKTHMEWYPEGTVELVGRPFGGSEVDAFTRSVDLMLFFETPFDWSYVTYCRDKGTKTVLMPMYEWTPLRWPAKPDALVCPSVLDLDYFNGQFPEGLCEFIPVPVDPSTWKLRTAARKYLHNAGNVGHREHKGTRQLLEALPHVESPLELTVRAQDTAAMSRILLGCKGVADDPRLKVEMGEMPYENLWGEHDVYVAPEKFNGLSLPLQEARAAGLLVMTTDRYPANTWLPREPLIHVTRTERASVGGQYLSFEECVLSPRDIAKVMDSWYEKDVTEYSLSGKLWAENNSWDKLLPRYREFFTKVVNS